MTVVSILIGDCFLKGESYLHLFYDDVTLDILRFEVKGDTKCKLSVILAEDGLKEEINLSVRREQGDKIEIITTDGKWKMVRVIEDSVKKIKLPPRIRIKAEWVV